MFATFILIVSLFTSAVFSAPAEESKIILKEIANRKIVGGEDANIEDYKYQGVLQRDGSFICGCALINNRYVVTAAHCTDGISSASRFTVRLGSSSANSGGVVYGVARIHQNPSYDDRTIDYDVSVLELEEDVEFSDSIGPIDYATQQPSGGAEAVISGYGYLSESGGLPTQLQVARVPIVDLAECRRQLGDDITDRMLCAGYDQGGVDACSGDSGGPLVVDGKLAGLVSWGYGCAQPGLPGVYTNVASVSDFIASQTS